MRKMAACLLLFSGLYASAQESNWDVYLAESEGKPVSIMLDMGINNSAPLKAYPYVIVTGVRFTGCRTDGMPTQAELNKLYVISDSIQIVMQYKTQNRLVGTYTHGCKRMDYYYIHDTTGLRNELARKYTALFPAYNYYINIQPDSNWSFYRDFLYPNEETRELMQNLKVVQQLQKSGDLLLKARNTDHTLYFSSEKDRNCFIAYAMKQNFTIESTGKDGKLSHPFRLRISREDKVDVNSITKITLALRREAAKCNGQYDGWETFVVK